MEHRWIKLHGDQSQCVLCNVVTDLDGSYERTECIGDPCDARIAALEAEVRRVTAERRTIATAYDDAYAECERLTAQLTVVTGERDALQRELHWLGRERDTLAAKLKAVTAEYDDLQSDGITGETQDRIRDMVCSLSRRDDIDGSGSDAGPVELTLAEIRQGFATILDERDSLATQLQEAREREGRILALIREAAGHFDAVESCIVQGFSDPEAAIGEVRDISERLKAALT
jgi:chromosome segregation ATPase